MPLIEDINTAHPYQEFFGRLEDADSGPYRDRFTASVAAESQSLRQAATEWLGEKKSVYNWLPLQVASPSWVRGAQGIGDCVSWGAELVATMTMAIQHVRDGIEWLGEAATEPIYGGSRVEARGGRLAGFSDGSYGAAAAKWLRDWGVLLRLDYSKETGNAEHDLRRYSSSKAKQWGNYGCGGSSDDPKGQGKLDVIGKKHPFRGVALVRTVDEMAALQMSGRVASIASGVGFGSMTRNSEGIVRRSGSWSHQMMIGGIKWTAGGSPLFRCFQSWGKSAKGPDPDIEWASVSYCSWWITPEDMEVILRAGDTWGFSEVADFKQREINYGTAIDKLWTEGNPNARLDVAL